MPDSLSRAAQAKAVGARRGKSSVIGIVIAGCLALVGIFAPRSSESAAAPAASSAREQIEADVPHLGRDDGYVSSEQCRACHAAEHASWHRSYHRSMTQLALPENVLGKFNGQTIRSNGLDYRIYREGDAFYAEMPNPDEMEAIVQRGKKVKLDDVPRVKRRVLMTTGSHHYQTYWVESTLPFRERLLQTLPLVYLKEADRWIPREEAFLLPPNGKDRFVTQWNHHCITCHSTGGIPGLNRTTGQLETRVAELGISCEACHGPGKDHVSRQEALAADSPSGRTSGGDDTIVHPRKLDHVHASEICGQCHGVFVAKDETEALKYARLGIQFRPGGELSDSRTYVRHPHDDSTSEEWAAYYRNPDFYRKRWWEDGTVLAGGREFTAMRESGCYLRGELSCLSCHTLHGEDPGDQLKPNMRGSAACTQCHQEPRYTTNVAEHTHHEESSAGSDCLNCHMPYKAYALFGGIRAHDIAAPNIASSVRRNVPNACNLCHMDKTLDWTQQQMQSWYGQQPLPLNEEQRTVSAAVLWLLKGDAPRRIITAWHLGWGPAQQASGLDWMAPYAARLLDDPYGVIRYVAHRSLRTLPGYNAFEFDFLGSPNDQQSAAKKALSLWKTPPRGDVDRRAVLLNADGRFDTSAFQSLYRQRDNRPVSIEE